MLCFHRYFDIRHNWTTELSALCAGRTLPHTKFLDTYFCYKLSVVIALHNFALIIVNAILFTKVRRPNNEILLHLSTFTLSIHVFSTTLLYLQNTLCTRSGPRYLRQYSDSLRAWRSGNRLPVEERFSAPVKIGIQGFSGEI